LTCSFSSFIIHMPWMKMKGSSSSPSSSSSYTLGDSEWKPTGRVYI
jgi:hypothetical protein